MVRARLWSTHGLLTVTGALLTIAVTWTQPINSLPTNVIFPGRRQANGTIRCLFCEGVPDLVDCRHEVTCQESEECSILHYRSPRGHMAYDLGCRERENCHGGRDGVEPEGTVLCQECCQDGDFCNRHGCGNKEPTNLQCFTCPHVLDPSHCEVISSCRPGDVCFIQIVFTEDFELRYQLGCIHKAICDVAVAQEPHPSQCENCCSRHYCNKGCPRYGTSSTATVRLTDSSQHPNVTVTASKATVTTPPYTTKAHKVTTGKTAGTETSTAQTSFFVVTASKSSSAKTTVSASTRTTLSEVPTVTSQLTTARKTMGTTTSASAVTITETSSMTTQKIVNNSETAELITTVTKHKTPPTTTHHTSNVPGTITTKIMQTAETETPTTATSHRTKAPNTVSTAVTNALTTFLDTPSTMTTHTTKVPATVELETKATTEMETPPTATPHVTKAPQTVPTEVVTETSTFQATLPTMTQHITKVPGTVELETTSTTEMETPQTATRHLTLAPKTLPPEITTELARFSDTPPTMTPHITEVPVSVELEATTAEIETPPTVAPHITQVPQTVSTEATTQSTTVQETPPTMTQHVTKIPATVESDTTTTSEIETPSTLLPHITKVPQTIPPEITTEFSSFPDIPSKIPSHVTKVPATIELETTTFEIETPFTAVPHITKAPQTIPLEIYTNSTTIHATPARMTQHTIKVPETVEPKSTIVKTATPFTTVPRTTKVSGGVTAQPQEDHHHLACYTCQFTEPGEECKHIMTCGDSNGTQAEFSCFTGLVVDNGCYITTKCIKKKLCEMMDQDIRRHGVAKEDSDEYIRVHCCGFSRCNGEAFSHADLLQYPQCYADQ